MGTLFLKAFRDLMVALLFIAVLSPFHANAQDPYFVQSYAAPLYFNPSLAGSIGCSRVALTYRNEWPTVSGTYDTYQASYDQYIPEIKGGIRIGYSYDVTMSKLSNAISGSHEITLGFLFNCKNEENQLIPLKLIPF